MKIVTTYIDYTCNFIFFEEKVTKCGLHIDLNAGFEL